LWTVIGRERWGCSTYKAQGDCTNSRSISTPLYENGVLGQLKTVLLNADAIALFIQRYNAGIRARQSEATANRAPLERKAADLRARVTRLIDAIADGAGEFQEVKDRLHTAKKELRDVESQLAHLGADTPIELSKDISERYRAYITELDTALAADGIARERAASAIRALIETITLTPKPQGRGVDIRVTGRMAEIINLAK
jgi:hypothetical protein